MSSLSLESEAVGGDAHDHGEDHHEHDHDAHGEHDEHAEHTNILLTYQAVCQQAGKIKSVELTLFDTWSGFDTLNTTFLTDEGANAARLTDTSARIDRP